MNYDFWNIRKSQTQYCYLGSGKKILTESGEEMLYISLTGMKSMVASVVRACSKKL